MCEPCEEETLFKNIPQEFKDALTCCICQDITTLPVHSLCCERAKSTQPACLSCVRKWYQQDRVPSQRTLSVKSFGGCGCNVSLNIKSPSYRKLYEHSFQLDMVRNALGPSVCFHEQCRVRFDTCEELRRHLQGKSRQSDKHGNCQYAITKCSECSMFGKRYFIEGKHYDEKHRKFSCPCCNQQISLHDAESHVTQHIREHTTEIKSIEFLSKHLEQKKKAAVETAKQLHGLRNMFWRNREADWNNLCPSLDWEAVETEAEQAEDRTSTSARAWLQSF
tara:strand:- start:223 stop:1056 length:834 start_codon:yes stop_codon:yes gene_type:complete